MAATWTKAVDVVFGSAETLSERVKAMTDGRFVITPYESGEIVLGLKVFDAVQEGVVECGHTSGAFYTVSLSPDDIFPAMEAGEIDAAEFVGPYDDEKLGLYNLAPYYYYPGWWDPGSLFEVYVNLDAWNQLPAEYQEIFKSAAVEANLKMLARYDAENGAALQRLISRGTKLLPFSPEILKTAKKIAIDIRQELATEDTAFQKVYEQWSQFRSEVYQWNQINELSFAGFAFNDSE